MKITHTITKSEIQNGLLVFRKSDMEKISRMNLSGSFDITINNLKIQSRNFMNYNKNRIWIGFDYMKNFQHKQNLEIEFQQIT